MRESDARARAKTNGLPSLRLIRQIQSHLERRSLMPEQTLHQSVLLNEVVEVLGPIHGGCYLDATFGNGGYSRAIWKGHCTVLAIDRDPDAIKRGATMKENMRAAFTSPKVAFPIWPALLIPICLSLRLEWCRF